MSAGRQEKRSATRVSINRDFESIEEFVAEYARDISLTGVFIRSKHPLPVGTQVNLKFSLIHQDIEIIEGVGEVVRTVQPPQREAGMGVKFLELTAESRDYIMQAGSRALR
ncbi:MAG: PilZ domain-containing protein [Bradymonadia bacterium]